MMCISYLTASISFPRISWGTTKPMSMTRGVFHRVYRMPNYGPDPFLADGPCPNIRGRSFRWLCTGMICSFALHPTLSVLPVHIILVVEPTSVYYTQQLCCVSYVFFVFLPLLCDDLFVELGSDKTRR